MKSHIGRTMTMFLSTLALSTTAFAQQSGSSGGQSGAAAGTAAGNATQNAPAFNPNSNPNPNPTSSPTSNPSASPVTTPAGPAATNPGGPAATNPGGPPVTNPAGSPATNPGSPVSATTATQMQNGATNNATQVFTTLDPGHKGYLSAPDVAANKFLSTNFQRCDTNGDSRLTQAETTLCLQSAPPGEQ